MLGAATLGLSAGNSGVGFSFVSSTQGSTGLTIPGQAGDILIVYASKTSGSGNIPSQQGPISGYTEFVNYSFLDANQYFHNKGYYKIRNGTETFTQITSAISGFYTMIAYRPTQTINSISYTNVSTSGSGTTNPSTRTLSMSGQTTNFIGLAQWYTTGSSPVVSTSVTPTRTIGTTSGVKTFEKQGNVTFANSTLSLTNGTGQINMLSVGLILLS